MLNGCGPASVAHHELCPLITGTFNAHSTLERTEGSCGRAKARSFDSYVFDSEGAFVSPLETLVSCRTDQEDCSITVHCATEVLDAKADFAGTLSRDGTELTGTATFSGRYQGCTKVVYQVVARLAVPRRVEAASRRAPPQSDSICPSKGPRGCQTPDEPP